MPLKRTFRSHPASVPGLLACSCPGARKRCCPSTCSRALLARAVRVRWSPAATEGLWVSLAPPGGRVSSPGLTGSGRVAGAWRTESWLSVESLVWRARRPRPREGDLPGDRCGRGAVLLLPPAPARVALCHYPPASERAARPPLLAAIEWVGGTVQCSRRDRGYRCVCLMLCLKISKLGNGANSSPNNEA